MSIRIEFSDRYIEKSLPVIKLTRSRNGKTGTATFIFIQPYLFHHFYNENLELKSLSLVCHQEKISTYDITIFFKEGKPYLIKGVFLFKNSLEWFTFLNFMQQYSKETGLAFSEK